MKKTANICILSVFLGILAVFSVLRLALPDREFSERENRYLQQRPAFSFSSLFSGEYTSRFELFCTDQFPFRDAWITVKARSELLSGKRENNGIFYGTDGVLLPRYDAPSLSIVTENVSFVNALSDNVDIPVQFALIPGASEVQSELLPDNAPNDSQADVIETAYSLSRAQTIDLLPTLYAHRGEYIFYRTDHHWTSLGAYYGYAALCDAWGLPVRRLDSFDRQIVSEDFYGTSYSSSGFSWVRPDEMELFVPDDGSVTLMSFETADGAEVPLYDVSKLEVKDKYAFFLGGNTPRLVVKTAHPEKPKLCLIRDSYADSLLPFLLEEFSEIDLIDLRYFKSSLSEYVSSGGFDKVLVLYSVANFSTDTNLFLLAM